MPSRSLLLLSFVAHTAFAAKPPVIKPTLSFEAKARADDERAVATSIVIGPQGTDYVLKLEFNGAFWGDACATHCTNTTLFLDTDNNKSTGLKLRDELAAENGADLALIIQGLREPELDAKPRLVIKVREFSGDHLTMEHPFHLGELSPTRDADRVLAVGNTLYLLVDATSPSLPSGPKLRAVYHPPDSKPLVALAPGLGAPATARLELFKDGRLVTPLKQDKAEAPKL